MADLLPLVGATRVVLNDVPFIPEPHLINCLAQVYRKQEGRNALVVALLCDDHLDPTGRLLGLVRKAAAGV